MKRFVKVFFICLLSSVMIAGFVLVFFSYERYKEAKEVLPVEDIREQLIEKTDHYVYFEDISHDLLNATYAVEDRRFYVREGIDFIALGRALMRNLTSFSLAEGGSTITQQLAKIVYFDYETSLTRKIAEYFFIYDLEDHYSKDEILEMYVNVINYGDGNIGIYEAAMNYFNKEPKDLDLFEASLLAAIPNSPANYQLSNDNPKTYQRQLKVLNDMLELGLINENEYDECVIEQGEVVYE